MSFISICFSSVQDGLCIPSLFIIQIYNSSSINRLLGSSVYVEKGLQGLNPSFLYKAWAGAKKAMEPVSRLKRPYPLCRASANIWCSSLDATPFPLQEGEVRMDLISAWVPFNSFNAPQPANSP